MKDLMDLTTEICAVSTIITGLTNDIDDECDKLRPELFQSVIYGVSSI